MESETGEPTTVLPWPNARLTDLQDGSANTSDSPQPTDCGTARQRATTPRPGTLDLKRGCTNGQQELSTGACC